jgi:iron complex outermembrane receptor protein
MWTFSKFFYIVFLWSFSISSTIACTTFLEGYVIEANSQRPLAFVTIVVPETGQVALSDSAGHFEVLVACEGKQQLEFSYVGYKVQLLALTLPIDTLSIVRMIPSTTTLNTVEVNALQAPDETTYFMGLNDQTIGDRASSNLGNLLSTLAGVSSLKNGSNISKPIVHGLYGNRLTLLNNGIAQSGQQWGNDHSPEIDPLTANSIQVIQGPSSLQYMSANLGTVVLLSPKAIGTARDWIFRGRYFLETNGWTNGIHLAAQHNNRWFAWRLNTTLQKGGDLRTPNYWLTNTGQQAANFSLQLERQWSPNVLTTLYASTFNTELGVLRGSHIGNLTDLENAFARAEPFFTQPTFSYNIQAPKQWVQHHLVKLQTEHQLNTQSKFEYTAALQLNDRQEFDVRRGNRTEKPALSLEQWSYFLEGRYEYQHNPSTQLVAGIQTNYIDNINQPETGVLPLIPDYTHLRVGAFLTAKKQWKRSLFEAGLRYDFHQQQVAAISGDLPRRIVRYNEEYHTINAALGWSYAIAPQLDLTLNTQYSTRNPGINELYSAGLHQGVSGIEEGDVNLGVERLAQGRVGLKGRIVEGLTVEGLVYYQNFDNYIYLQPQENVRVTIRGVFPVFIYEQTDAHIYGADAGLNWQINAAWRVGTRYSYLRGWDLTQDRALINMPANNLQSYLAYEIQPQWKLGKGYVQDLEFRLQHQYVAEQTLLADLQDFLPPPPAYHLLQLSTSTTIISKNLQMRLVLRVDNLLNTPYRDYLNRQRYFADAQGINAVLTASVSLAPPAKTH